jgi:nitrous oxidase accessory protein NosD
MKYNYCYYVEDKSMKNNSFSETVEHVKHISVRHVSPVVGLILIFFYV